MSGFSRQFPHDFEAVTEEDGCGSILVEWLHHVSSHGREEMPKNSKVGRCVRKVTPKKGKVSAIKICTASTGQSYKTGRKSASGKKTKQKRK